MRLVVAVSAAAVLGCLFFAYSSLVSANAATPGLVSISDSQVARGSAERLEFRDIVDHSGGQPRLGDRVLGLSGKRVRVTGYIAHLESAPQDGFFVVPIPVHGDESGAGRGDLPLESIFVVTPSNVGSSSDPIDAQVEVVGQLEVGRHEAPDGNAHWLQIISD